MMKRSVWGLAAAFASVAGMQAQAAQPNAPPRQAGTLPLTSQAGGVPLTIAFIYSPSYYGIELNKGIASINSPRIGVFCMTPRVPLKPTAVPVVTVDWGGSSGSSLAAFGTYRLVFCTTGQIEVHTFNFVGAATNQVAFQVTVE